MEFEAINVSLTKRDLYEVISEKLKLYKTKPMLTKRVLYEVISEKPKLYKTKPMLTKRVLYEVISEKLINYTKLSLCLRREFCTK
ncbi:hypothetical protein B9T62_35390 [Paenibacillus donghaensis]|uniref:Uncharacterized protein n=1 Tax=Paenibacillus donghaensis TaxID=414771 RepID=A0A2Z2KMD2_9BACL|nr:hypothetical protein B9T62_35390 [Paenibacillus donghaensis]